MVTTHENCKPRALHGLQEARQSEKPLFQLSGQNLRTQQVFTSVYIARLGHPPEPSKFCFSRHVALCSWSLPISFSGRECFNSEETAKQQALTDKPLKQN